MKRDPRDIAPKYLEQGVDPAPIEARQRWHEARKKKRQWAVFFLFVCFIPLAVLAGVVAPVVFLPIIGILLTFFFIYAGRYVLIDRWDESHWLASEMHRELHLPRPDEQPEDERHDHPIRKRDVTD